MKYEDVPQDDGVQGNLKRLNYAVDDAGHTVTVASSGFEPVNIANRMAWERLERALKEMRQAVATGEASPLAYHALARQMDVGLLSSYSGIAKWRVRRHLKARPYAKLKPAVRQRYAEALNMPLDKLDSLPENDEDAALADTI